MGNNLGPETAKAFGASLSSNAKLVRLNLEYGRMGSEGAQALAAGLAGNTALQGLYLSFNEMEQGDKDAISDAWTGAGKGTDCSKWPADGLCNNNLADVQ